MLSLAVNPQGGHLMLMLMRMHLPIYLFSCLDEQTKQRILDEEALREKVRKQREELAKRRQEEKEEEERERVGGGCMGGLVYGCS